MRIDPVRNMSNQNNNKALEDKLNSKDIKNLTENFNRVLNNKGIRNNEKVNTVTEWIDSLSDLKEKLKDEATRDNLNKYKESVKKFLDYYIKNEVYLETKTVPDGLYHTKTIKIIKSVNSEINKLTEELLKDQQGNLELLRSTGRIQGMLFELIL